MVARFSCVIAVLLIAPLAAGPRSVSAAMRIRQPGAETSPAPSGSPTSPPAEDRRQPSREFFVGSVIFARGSQIVVEVKGGAKSRERFIVYDSGLRRLGQAMTLKALDRDVYLLEPLGSYGVSPGDRLARESETEAAARVLRENRAESYREFLEVFPESPYKPRIARELFRVAVRSSYPTFPGLSIRGKVRLVETVSREVPLGQAEVMLDRFVIARTDEKGSFLIEGIPKLEVPVALKIRVRDRKFQMAQDTAVDLQAGSLTESTVELPVKLTPTVLVGRVLDERGTPLPGAEVWTEPYTMEALTDEDGGYRILRRKELAAAAAAPDRDEPLFGGDYAVYAHRKGRSVDRVTVSAEGYRENAVGPLRLAHQDARTEDLPSLGIDPKDYLDPIPADLAAPVGSGPRLNP